MCIRDSISGAASGSGFDSYTASFVAPSFVTIYYDTNVSDGLTAGSAAIGTASLPTSGSTCVVSSIPSAGIETGACVLNFVFDAASVTAPGVWTAMGQDLGLLPGVKMRVDMNVDNFTDPFNPSGPGFFSPTFASAGGTQTRLIDHNGSASFVPVPASLALLGLSLIHI